MDAFAAQELSRILQMYREDMDQIASCDSVNKVCEIASRTYGSMWIVSIAHAHLKLAKKLKEEKAATRLAQLFEQKPCEKTARAIYLGVLKWSEQEAHRYAIILDSFRKKISEEAVQYSGQY